LFDAAEKLLPRVQSDVEIARVCSYIGNWHQGLDDIPKALELHERSLALAEKLEDRSQQAAQLDHLANCYYAVGNIHNAIDFHERSLALEEELGGIVGQAVSLGKPRALLPELGRPPQGNQLFPALARIGRECRKSGRAGEGVGQPGQLLPDVGRNR